MRFLRFFGICIGVSLVVAKGFASEVLWKKEQLEKASIYLPLVPEPPQKKKAKKPAPVSPLVKSAEDLQHYIEVLTGVEVPVVQAEDSKNIPKNQPAFVLGRLATELGAKPPETAFKQDGYVMELKGSHLLLAGEGEAGTAFAVSDFLHRQGIRWYMPGPYGEVVPKQDFLRISSTPISETPAFEHRWLWLNGGAQNRFAEVAPEVPESFNDWVRRNRLNEDRRLPVQHMWSGVFRSNKISREEALEKHPDWFLVINGKRNMHHLNLLNEEVVDLFVNFYMKALAGEPKDVSKVLSISPDDQVILNQSVEAQEWMSRPDLIFTNLPDATDYLIQFNNRVMEKVHKEYPNVRLAFYIYSNYQNAPTNVEIHKNLIPFLAPLNFSRYHALSDRTKPNRTLLASIVERWHDTGAELGWRDYSFLCPDAMMPFTRLHMTRRDIPWLYAHGVRYMNTETVSNWPNLVPEFYLLSRLLWKVDIDQDKELVEFYTNFFGPAAKNMEAYINEVSHAYDDLPFSSGNKEFADSVFTPERMKFLREQIDQAKIKAASNEKIMHRIGMVETALKQAERFMAMRAAVNRFDYAEAAKENDAILQAFDDDLKFDPYTNTLFVKNAWYTRFYGKHVQTVKDWLEGAQVVYVFPDEWPAHIDFTKTGEYEGLQNPDTKAFDLFSLKTYSRSLAEQGWEKVRSHIWYQQKFPKITVPPGKELYVVFGGVDRFLKVWINGREVGEGTGGRGFDPVCLPVKDFQSEEENTLTVRVINEAITELGVGGLIRPVALIVRTPLKDEDAPDKAK